MTDNLTDIESAHLTLVNHFLEPTEGEPDHRGLVAAIAILIPSDSLAEENLAIFLATAASPCEEDGILDQAKVLAKPFIPRIFRSGSFEGLQAAPGDALAALDSSRYNIPPVSVGTFGMVAVDSGGNQYAVSSNHVLANNGRTPAGTAVYFPGPVEDPTNGSALATFTGYVPLTAPVWPVRSGTAAPNSADCAWAKLKSPLSLAALRQVDPPQTSVAKRTPVTKLGRTTWKTESTIMFRRWHGFVDFSFGTYYFVDQLATYDESGTPSFAEPGDSGSVATVIGQTDVGVGLVFARGYHYDRRDNFKGCITVICRLELIAEQMQSQLGRVTFYL